MSYQVTRLKFLACGTEIRGSSQIYNQSSIPNMMTYMPLFASDFSEYALGIRRIRILVTKASQLISTSLNCTSLSSEQDPNDTIL